MSTAIVIIVCLLVFVGTIGALCRFLYQAHLDERRLESIRAEHRRLQRELWRIL